MRSSSFMSSVSWLLATSGTAADEQMNLLVVQLRFITVFFVCERWNNFDNHFSLIFFWCSRQAE